jgi:hypothetical protein
MFCILDLNRRPGRGVRIDEDLADVVESEDEQAEHGGESRDLCRVEEPSISSGDGRRLPRGWGLSGERGEQG